MRKLAAAALAVPILATFYIPVLLRRSVAARLGIAIGLGGIIGMAAIGALAPALTTATPPSSPAPVAMAAFGPAVRTDVAPDAGVGISFSKPMDRSTVAAALTVSPTSSISLDWGSDGTLVTVRPRTGWALDTLYTITVGAIAADSGGHRLTGPLRTTFVTRAATTGSILATSVHGSAADPTTAFEVRFDRPVDVAAAEAAFAISPTTAGTFQDSSGATADSIVFTPSAALTPGATYTVSLTRSIADADGAATAPPVALSVQTGAAPRVVRFRPRTGTTEVSVGARLSVRFTEPMDRVSTAAAFGATANGKAVTGTMSWYEGDTVLLLTP
ncbi:MAG TPA: Ig-like domain-containing protein, partial [Candidatus Binatia bacterium]|nr:Ig-like domain-containing protein [Candidatus Binatia bacterium]